MEEILNKVAVVSGTLVLLGIVNILNLHWILSIFVFTIPVVYFVGTEYVLSIIRTLPRDIGAGLIYLKILSLLRTIVKNNITIPAFFSTTARKFPKKTMFVCEGKTYTFEEVEQISNRIARYFQQAGYKKGDTISLFMQNSPEVVIYWLGLAKIGVCSALINFNLKMEALIHCVTAAESKAIIFDETLQSCIEEVKDTFSKTDHFKIYYVGYSQNPMKEAVFLDPLIKLQFAIPPVVEDKLLSSDKLIYIYTSGTTGLPKAAIIRHIRYFFMAASVNRVFDITSNDTLYITLPLYHSNGGILNLGQALISGCTAVIKKKFSASSFWEDCIAYNCTVTSYIGEVCRYLLAQPQKPTDVKHKIRLMFGNGLRQQIWEEFVHRFKIKQIGEFYGATESNANLVNIYGKPGAVGFLSLIATRFFPLSLIRIKEETGEVLRDSNGFCIQCKPGDVGQLVGKIKTSDPLMHFDGYVSKEATNKKVISNVFKKGDSYFSTGDLLLMDKDGYLFFKDRLGDTFRWKGENVSTAEVEAKISNILNLKDVVVYGVSIKGIEGKAGMAAIADVLDSEALDNLAVQLKVSLPPYACPLFLRLVDAFDMTGTFKVKKTTLQEEGFNPDVIKDQLYFMNSKSGHFEVLTNDLYNDIQSGVIRL